MTAPYKPDQVIPPELAAVVDSLPTWFVIGGQAVRCFVPYRPSRDVDFGVDSHARLNEFVEHLRQHGTVEIQERSPDTLHLLWNGVKVSVFVFTDLARHVEDRHLDVTGVLATKLHAILDRGLRRDFFDLYVMLESQRLGIAAVLDAIRSLHGEEVDTALLLRALTWFDDADRETPLPGEGPRDWRTVKDYFLVQVGSLLAPPARTLSIQSLTIDVKDG